MGFKYVTWILTLALLLLLPGVAGAQSYSGGGGSGDVSDGGMTSGTIPKYDGTNLVDSLLSETGTRMTMAGQLTHTAGTIPTGEFGLTWTGTSSGGGGAQVGFDVQYTGAQNGGAGNSAMRIILAGTNSSANLNTALHATNHLNSTGTAFTAGSLAGGDVGLYGYSNKSAGVGGAGTGTGVYGTCQLAGICIGVTGSVNTANNSRVNIGVAGNGYNQGTSPTQIGGYFSLDNSNPTLESAALIADNHDQTDPIFLGRDEGTVRFTIADGGDVTILAPAAAPGLMTLQTAELTVVDTDILGRIDFQAPLESDGSDAILVAASIYAEANATFSASVNTTDLVFAIGNSETAVEKARITKDFVLLQPKSLRIGADGVDGASGGNITFGSSQNHVFGGSALGAGTNGFYWTDRQSDSATSVGGNYNALNLTTAGAVIFQWQDLSGIVARLDVGPFLVLDEAGANPTTTALDQDDSVGVYTKADKFVVAYNDGGTMTYISIPLDGSTTTWTHSTSAP